MNVEVRDLGVMGYGKAHELQVHCVERQLSGGKGSEVVLMTEHPPVFTLGRRGNLSSLLRSKKEILSDGVEIVHTERGGDITYHGPGQLVVYPILNLRLRRLSVTEFISRLEDIMLRSSAELGVAADRDQRNRGIWVGNNKVGSVGIRVRHGVTFHGLSLNVNLSLEHFKWIEPCGLTGVGVTSLEKELKRPLSMIVVKEIMHKHIKEILLR